MVLGAPQALYKFDATDPTELALTKDDLIDPYGSQSTRVDFNRKRSSESTNCVTRFDRTFIAILNHFKLLILCGNVNNNLFSTVERKLRFGWGKRVALDWHTG